tara:strand:+ start:648 stop:1118 length:471 start_codon:yes stop_codon:yes gene_type:complete
VDYTTLNDEETVNNAIKIVREILPDDGGFLKEIAKAESNYGVAKGTFREGYSGGIWQVDKIGFESTKDINSHPRLQKRFDDIEARLGIKWYEVEWNQLEHPLYSCLASRLFLLNKPGAIPKSLKERAEYWKKHYNSTLGAGSAGYFMECNKDESKC